MADLSRYRGAASALLAAGFAAAAVIGGASAIVHARETGVPAASAAPSASTNIRPQPAASSGDELLPMHVKVAGLHKWRPAKIPKRLKLKPVVRHVHKVVTVVSAVAVAPAASAAPAVPAPRKARPQHKAAKRHKAHVTRKHKERSDDGEDKHAAKRPSAPAPATNPVPGNGTATATPTVSPPQAPPPPAAPPPPPTTPTGTVALSGGKSIGQTLTAIWAGADPATTTYQWQLCNQDGNACQPIPNETHQTYALRASDLGLTVRVVAVCGTYSSTSRATDQIESRG